MRLRRRPPIPAAARPPANQALVITSAAVLAAELEPGDTLFAVTIHAISGGQMVAYSLIEGQDGIHRAVSTGDPVALHRAAEALSELFVSATPEEVL